MQENIFLLPQEIYAEHLNMINGVKFSKREVDVIACMLSGRTAKETARLLSVGQKTVETHIYNVKKKLECSSIITAMEESNNHLILQKYYLSLLAHTNFEQCLNEIVKLNVGEIPSCLIIYGESDKNHPFLHQLKAHLQLVGIKPLFEERKQWEPLTPTSCMHVVLYLVTKEWIDSKEGEQDINPVCENINFLLLDVESEHVFLSNEYRGSCISFGKNHNYYFSFFELLNKLLPQCDFNSIVMKFKKKYGLSIEPLRIDSSKKLGSKKFFFLNHMGSFIEQRKWVILTFLLVIATISSLTVFISIGGNSEKTPQRIPVARSDFIIPNKPVFLKRLDIITQIDNYFKKQDPGIQTLALVGIGGSGKTTLAREYARHQKENVVWELNAETLQSLRKSFYLLAHAVGQTSEDQKFFRGLELIKDPTEKEEKIIKFVRGHLKALPNWFLIYDNVEVFTDIQKYFPQDATTWGNGKIIVTTRDGHIQNNSHINHIIEIGELSPSQKLELFKKILGHGNSFPFTPVQEQEVNAFLDHIPSFPLDISVAAYYLKATNTTYDQYLERIKGHNQNVSLVQEKILKDATNYTKTRYGIITLSLEHLINNHKDFSELLLFMSLLNSQNIPRGLLDLFKDAVIIDDFIYHLKKYSLISNESSGVTLSIHRSTQAVMLDYLEKSLDSEDKKQVISLISKTFQTYAEQALEKEDFQQMSFFISHAETFLTHELFLNDTIKGFVKGYLGSIYRYLGEYAKSRQLLEESLTTLSKYGDRFDMPMASFLAHLGVDYGNLGNNEKGIQLLKQSVAIFKKHFPENKVHYVHALGTLANLYRELGDYKKALDLFNEGVTIYQKKLPEYDLKMGAAFVFLGHLNIDFGHYKKAINFLEKGLAIYTLNVPKEHIGRGWALGYLGIAYLEVGNYEKARRALEESLMICKKHFHDMHTWVHWVSIHLGVLHGKLSDYEKALNLLERGLASYEKYYGKNHIETARTLINFGEIYLMKGAFETAEMYMTRAHKILEDNKHPDQFMALECLADLYLKESSYEQKKLTLQQSKELKDKAINYLRSALEIVKIHFPEDSLHQSRIELKLKNVE